MADHSPLPEIPPSSGQLERGELGAWAVRPFFIPGETDFETLAHPLRMHAGTKDISFDPTSQTFSGRRLPPDAITSAFQDVLNRFSLAAREWLVTTFPEYARGLTPDRVTWRGTEEATRRLRHTARNDLLHIDNFPTRPTQGRRILRLFVNLDPADPQVWATSDRFSSLLERFREKQPVPMRSDAEWLAVGARWLRLLKSGWRGRSEYDAMMLRLHHFLKNDHAFQTRATRKIWMFPPGSAWLVFTDSLSYAWLRGRYTLEHSFFVSPEALREPDESPLAQLCRLESPSLLPMAG
ncbi:Kdo hydroxylase family protein [Zavarzinella formosa]|uniref:Kdo hydroxylase family protein n=1 Tax=Zavarzinella formosa TaxID=360055 RepID=UPI00069705D1|nr:Kdo hydroxylase family protein [Zavarzinella formosa]